MQLDQILLYLWTPLLTILGKYYLNLLLHTESFVQFGVDSKLAVLLTKTFDILPKTIMEYQI